jgi:hypothetical protein
VEEFEISQKVRVPVKYLRAECHVRYWEDATVNGVEDTDGSLIPCREGAEAWAPQIDLATGKIQNWRQGTKADIHYKVCDAGVYELRNEAGDLVSRVDGYVIGMMCPEGNGYGDYIIMKVDENGVIANWKVDLTEFEGADE